MAWIRSYPAMTILAESQCEWTRRVEKVLNNPQDINGLKKVLEILEEQLQEVVNEVRNEKEEVVRLSIGSLIVIEVHNRDVLAKLIQDQVTRINEFGWTSQVRYYNLVEEDKFDITVNCISSEREYGFEYLGVSSRLVITPLTDRCYRTLMGAYQMVYGGGPEGPAGTGKTETIKDLSKAIAVLCLVFNCSDQLNYQAMRKLFKG